MERPDEAAEPSSLQQQPVPHQLEQQQQLHRSRPIPAIDTHQFEEDLAWVMHYEPDHLP